MKKTWLFALALLFASLVIYLFYRTEETVVNTMAAWLLGRNRFKDVRALFRFRLPLPSFVVYSLPEMLWTAAFTLLSGNLYVRIFRKKYFCFWIPLLVSVGLELLQLLPRFPGRFDWADLIGSVLAWATVVVFFRKKTRPAQNLLERPDAQRLAFVGCYAIMYLAHVWR